MIAKSVHSGEGAAATPPSASPAHMKDNSRQACYDMLHDLACVIASRRRRIGLVELKELTELTATSQKAVEHAKLDKQLDALAAVVFCFNHNMIRIPEQGGSRQSVDYDAHRPPVLAWEESDRRPQPCGFNDDDDSNGYDTAACADFLETAGYDAPSCRLLLQELAALGRVRSPVAFAPFKGGDDDALVEKE
jgi:hypothetical protein